MFPTASRNRPDTSFVPSVPISCQTRLEASASQSDQAPPAFRNDISAPTPPLTLR